MRGGKQPRDDTSRDSFHCVLWLLLKLWPNSQTNTTQQCKGMCNHGLQHKHNVWILTLIRSADLCAYSSLRGPSFCYNPVSGFPFFREMSTMIDVH